VSWARELGRLLGEVPDALLEHAAHHLREAPLVLTAGNGGSASLASHAAQALAKPDLRAGGGQAAVCLTDAIPTASAHANDGGFENALLESARPFFKLRPALLLISSSGNSENVVRLAREAHLQHLRIISMTGFDGGRLRPLASLALHVESRDYEIVEPAHDALLHRMQYHFRRLGMQ
jgi:D-sedoheptulose 7-phosphate isomerase